MRRLRKGSSFAPTAPVITILPVEWGRSWQVLEEEIRVVRPDGVLLFGLHAQAERLRIELSAANERQLDRPDAAGRLAEAAAILAGPDTLRVSLPLDAIRHGLGSAGIEYELSEDAGRYLCNETLFRLCASATDLGVRRYGFIHTPLTSDCASETEGKGAGLRTIDAAVLEHAAGVLVACLREDLLHSNPETV